VRRSAGAMRYGAEHRKVKNRGQEEEEEAVGNDKAYPKGYSESNRVGIRPKGKSI